MKTRPIRTTRRGYWVTFGNVVAKRVTRMSTEEPTSISWLKVSEGRWEEANLGEITPYFLRQYLGLSSPTRKSCRGLVSGRKGARTGAATPKLTLKTHGVDTLAVRGHPSLSIGKNIRDIRYIRDGG